MLPEPEAWLIPSKIGSLLECEGASRGALAKRLVTDQGGQSPQDALGVDCIQDGLTACVQNPQRALYIPLDPKE